MFEPLPLAADETLLWQGRPAPRAYTFRNWRHALFGLALMLPCLFWQMVGIELVAAGAPRWVAWLPLPFNLASLYLAFGQLLIARLEWEQVLYVVSDRTIYQRRGFFRPRLRCLPLAAVTSVRKKVSGRISRQSVSTAKESRCSLRPSNILNSCCAFFRTLSGRIPLKNIDILPRPQDHNRTLFQDGSWPRVFIWKHSAVR